MSELFRLSRSASLTLMVCGVYWGGLAGLMPEIKAHVGASDGVMGLVLLAPAIGSVIAMGLVPWAAKHLGAVALPLAGGMIALALLGYFVAGSAPVLAAVLFFGGFSVAFADMTANVRLAEREVASGRHLMNFTHGMFSVSFALTAFGIALARKAGFGHLDIVPWLAALALVYVGLGWERWVEDHGTEEGAAHLRAPWVTVGLAGLVLFASFIGENATEAWSALHIERTLGAEDGVGSFGPAMLGVVMALGRFSGQLLAKRLGERNLVFGSAFFAVAGALVISTGGSVAQVLSGVVLMGVGVAVTVPSTTSILARKVSAAVRPKAISRAWMLGLVGFFVGPSMMGGLAEIGSLRLSFAAVAVIVALIVPAVIALDRR